MIESFINWLQGMPNKEAAVITIAALPVSELRGAIPAALAFGMSLQKAFLLGVIGNLLPVIPILVFFEPVSDKLGKTKLFKRFFEWLKKRTLNKADNIQKYEMLGLILFVAIPLPMTGAYSGAIAASLLKMKFRYGFLGCLIGILCAGIIVAIVCTLGGRALRCHP